MTEEKQNFKRITVTEFKAGEKTFISTGVSSVKVTDKDNITCLDIPIQSTGVTELIETFKDKAPAPPLENTLITPESDPGIEMGINKNTWVKMPNFGDAVYLKEKEDHDSDLGMAVLLKGLAVDIKDEAGEMVTDRNKKIKILKSMGMSGDQFQQIINDVQDLTRWSDEERESFFVEK